jgi:hypothetical protein
MSELSYAQQRDIIERLREAFEHDPERTYPDDTAMEIVDSWLPVYYTDIVEQWQEAGCPDPDDTMPEQIERDKRPIHHLMTLGLWELASGFASGAIWGDNGLVANTHAEALENLKTTFPDFAKQSA